jgi:4'-phosphopantetheinyl transferase
VSVDDFPLPGNAIASPVAGIALWCAPLAATDEAFAHMAACLSPAEKARAARFGRDDLRRRYIIGRSLLRALLGRTLALSPAAVPIVRGPRGRPQLDGIAGIDFNVSHTRDMSLAGIARAGRIGVDIERADREVDADRLARRVLAARERDAIAQLDADERRRRFLRYWTCKEAMSKATGDGIAAPFRRLEVTLDASPRLVAGPSPYEPEHWRLYAIDPQAGYFGTLAVWDARAEQPAD